MAQQANCSIYGFGFGKDHDAALLSDLAEQAQTPFTFVENTENIREAFAGAVGGLSSIVAQTVELTITSHVQLKNVHTPFATRMTSATCACRLSQTSLQVRGATFSRAVCPHWSHHR